MTVPARRVGSSRGRAPELVADKAGVLAALGQSGACVVNALTEEQHRGTGGVSYGRPGRIAGTGNVPARALVDPETHAYLPDESAPGEVRARQAPSTRAAGGHLLRRRHRGLQ